MRLSTHPLYRGTFTLRCTHFHLTTQSLNKSHFRGLLLPLRNIVLPPPDARKPFLRFLGVPDQISLAFTFQILIARHARKTAVREWEWQHCSELAQRCLCFGIFSGWFLLEESCGKSDGGCVDCIQQQHKVGEKVHQWKHIELLLGFMLRVCCRNSAHSPKPHDIAVGLLCPCTF